MLTSICFVDINVNIDLKREWFADWSFIIKGIDEIFDQLMKYFMDNKYQKTKQLQDFNNWSSNSLYISCFLVFCICEHQIK